MDTALTQLEFASKRAVSPIKKLINSAVSNAKHNFNAEEKDLFVKEVRIDEGVTMKRYRARAFGRAGMIRKRTSRVAITLGVNTEDDAKKGVKKGKIQKNTVKDENTKAKKEKSPETLTHKSGTGNKIEKKAEK